MHKKGHGAPKFEISFSNGCNALYIQCHVLFQAKHRRLCREIIAALLWQPNIDHAYIDLNAATLNVDFTPGCDSPNQLANSVAEAIRAGLTAWKALPAGKSDDATQTHTEMLRAQPIVATGKLRIWLLLKASASFVMTIIGMILPGIPTLPFLILTSYYLARSSPRLHTQLLKSHFLGDILRDWEQNYALSYESKKKLLQILFVVTALTLLVLPKTPLSLGLVAVSVLLSLYGIQSLPDDRQSGITPSAEPAV
ncbi:YbaN family protein [Candidatus Methylospira mobilis]|nr:YbaN family protein [Candidatus Methylospira mobilis]